MTAKESPVAPVGSVLRRRPILLEVGVVTIGLTTLPLLVSNFRLGLVAGYLGLAIMAIGLDLVWGYTGILSIGQAAFFGTTTYVTAILIQQLGWSPLPAAIAGIAASLALAGVVSGFVFFSSVGPFFVAIITLALGVLLEQVVNQFSTITGGFNGIVLSDFGPPTTVGRYALSAVVAVIALAVAAIVASSDFGRTMRAVRDDEKRLQFLGYRVPLIKTIVFVGGALFAAIGGLVFIVDTQYVSASNIGFTLSTEVIIWTAISGRGTIIGPFLGAIGISVLGQSLSGSIVEYWQLALGTILLLIIVFAPDGLYPPVRRRLGVKYREPRHIRSRAMPEFEGHAAALQVAHVSKRFGKLTAVDDVSFALQQGEIVCLVGPNGAGKSSLINSMTGTYPPNDGSVTVGDFSLVGRSPDEIARRGVIRTFQTTRLFDGLDVFENMFLAARAGTIRLIDLSRRSTIVEVPRHVGEFLRTGGLDDRLDDSPPQLSHGLRQWLELCMAMAAGSRLLLLDEPTAGLTNQERAAVGSTLRQLTSGDDVGLLLIEHDLEFVSRLANTVLVMHQGRLVASGSVSEVASDPFVRQIYLGVSS